MSSKVAVVAKLVAKPGRRGDLVAAMRELATAAASEEGTEVYAIHEGAGDDDSVWVYELYRDQAGLSAHSASDTMKSIGGRLGDILAGRAEITLLRPVAAKGVDVD
ncbi:MAG TPA: putative quinol monooxygenase [Acidimicrobiales bacterium]|nr:putative quinol monooxygenase [Acidimicrobiales bacterium]